MSYRDVATLLRFLIVGAGNTMLGLGVIFLGLWLGLSDVAANALGYGIGLLFSFAANRRWTFRHAGAVSPAFWRFLLVVAVAYAMNLTATLVALRLLGLNPFLAQLAGVGPYTAIFYLGSRRFVFQPGPAAQPEVSGGR